jgi:hypothetical protein
LAPSAVVTARRAAGVGFFAGEMAALVALLHFSRTASAPGAILIVEVAAPAGRSVLAISALVSTPAAAAVFFALVSATAFLIFKFHNVKF